MAGLGRPLVFAQERALGARTSPISDAIGLSFSDALRAGGGSELCLCRREGSGSQRGAAQPRATALRETQDQTMATRTPSPAPDRPTDPAPVDPPPDRPTERLPQDRPT